MRLIIMFDLPTDSAKDRREYYLFRKFLIKNGFLMLQESIYCKLMQNATAMEGMVGAIYKNRPPKGSVLALKITEKQYSKMEYIVGESTSEILNTEEKLVIL